VSKHIEISVKTNPLWAEYVSELLINRVGCYGVVTEEKEFRDEVVVKADVERVKGYLPFSSDFNIEDIRHLFAEERKNLINSGISAENIGCWTVETKEIREEDWAHNWKLFWHPQKIGKNIVICPTWEEYAPQQDDVMIYLDPGSAFGTGTHPTTKLCIEALEKLIPEFSGEINMADIGTGSGILAITAAKLGVKSVIGVDNDASVIAVAKENAEKNGVNSQCTFFAGSAADVEGKYDIVTANILAEVLVDMMPELARLLKPSGILVLSGIINKKLPLIQESLGKTNLRLKEVLWEDVWIATIVSG